MDAVVGWLSDLPCSVLIATVVAGVAIIIRKYIKGANFTEVVNANGKVAIVTGASSGIGKEIARELNLRGAKVYMLCRDREKTLKVIDELVKSGCDRSRLLFAYGDLASFATIRSFVKSFLQDESRLDILVNNAGIMGIPTFQRTVDGNEVTFQCNHLGHFLLTDLLIESLCASGHGRIVAVSSLAHLHADSVDEDIVNSPDGYGWIKAYQRSKLANMMHVRSLTSQWRECGENRMTANACHPGAVYTNILQHTFVNREPIRSILSPLLAFFMKSELEGAQTPLFLALSPRVEGISGEYFSDCGKADMSPLATDAEICARLYDFSKRAVEERTTK